MKDCGSADMELLLNLMQLHISKEKSWFVINMTKLHSTLDIQGRVNRQLTSGMVVDKLTNG